MNYCMHTVWINLLHVSYCRVPIMSHPPPHAKGFGQECDKDQPIIYNFLSSLVTLDVFWPLEDLLESTLSISFSVLALHFFSKTSQSHVSLCMLKCCQMWYLQLPLCICFCRFASWVGWVKQELGGQANFCCAQLLIEFQAMFMMPCQYLQMLDYYGPASV